MLTAIDRNTWRVRDNTFLNQDQAWITKGAATMHDGALNITGKRLAPAEYRINDNALYGDQIKIRDCSTGYIDTIEAAGFGNAASNRSGQKYGHFDMRAWVTPRRTRDEFTYKVDWVRVDQGKQLLTGQ